MPFELHATNILTNVLFVGPQLSTVLSITVIIVMVVLWALLDSGPLYLKGSKQTLNHKAADVPVVADRFPEFVSLTEAELAAAKETRKTVSMAMTTPEIAFFLRLIKESKSYFEFGCGGSSRVAAAFGPEDLKIASVDSSKEWIAIVLQDAHVKAKVDANMMRMEHIDIGPIGQWGRPLQSVEESKGAWSQYSQAINMMGGQYDTVLVDGRFRVACALNTFLTNPTAKVLVHDFFDHWHHEDYRVLLNVTDVVARVDTLVQLNVKPTTTKAELTELYAAYVNVMQ